MTDVRVSPEDHHNKTLVENVHPSGWRNPLPTGRYNLVVVGAGSAGLITSLVASSLGAKVALIERHLMGGDCLNVGCVPSKAVLHAARSIHAARSAAAFGLAAPPDVLPDFGAAMERMREVRAHISQEDSARRYRDEFGIDVFLGQATFTGRDRIEVDGTELRFRKAVIATGGRPTLPPIPGLAEAGAYTNETIFELTERPERLAVIGGGPIGCELAQAFQRLGSQVTLLEGGPQVLSREDPDAARLVQDALVRDGVRLVVGARIQEVVAHGSERRLRVAGEDGAEEHIPVEAILVAAGRAPQVDGLGLEAAGVEFDPRRGIVVDDRLRTANPRIYGAGDVCMAWKFTHAADAAAKLVVQNALFFGRKKISALNMPWCTYTDPEIAHVGMYPRDAAERGIEIDTYETPFEKINRAVTDGEEEGFVRVHCKKGSDRILGATLVGAGAGELVGQFGLAMNARLGLGTFTNVIYPYPTKAEVIKATAGAYTRTRLTPMAKRLFETFLRAIR